MSDRERIRQEKAEELRRKLSDGPDGGEAASDRTEPVHIESADQFRELLGEGGVVLADFYADWCGPCKMLEPTVAEIAAQTPATVAKIDVDRLQQLAREYRVQGVPTMYLFADGERVERMVGVRQKGELVSLIERYA